VVKSKVSDDLVVKGPSKAIVSDDLVKTKIVSDDIVVAKPKVSDDLV
jgi:hypothetical protein